MAAQGAALQSHNNELVKCEWPSPAKAVYESLNTTCLNSMPYSLHYGSAGMSVPAHLSAPCVQPGHLIQPVL